MTLNQAMPEWDDGSGIFSKLNAATTLPWASVSATGLDIAYHGQRSGSKFIAPMLYNWLDTSAEITTTGYTKLTTALIARYMQKWTHLWTIYTKQYDPLQTYSLTESGESDRTRTPNLTTTDSLDQTDVHDGTVDSTETPAEMIATQSVSQVAAADNRFGFNTTPDAPVPNSTASESTTSSTNESHSGTNRTQTDSDYTDTRDADSTRHETGTESYEEDYTKTRVGNMYRSPAELLSFDRDFWLQDFFSIVFQDVDDMLTLQVYSESPVNRTVF